MGVGAVFSGSALALPGVGNGKSAPATISAYVDLPNGIISTRTNLTIEVWATLENFAIGQRLFDFGQMNIAGLGQAALPGEITPDAIVAPGVTQSSDELMLSVTFEAHRLAGRLNGAAELGTDGGAAVSRGVRLHVVTVVEDGEGNFGASGMQARWYLNGVMQRTLDLDFRLAAIEDVNNWLGRSQFSADWMARITYDEFRIYDHAMTELEITNSMNAGPSPAAPVAVADSVTIHPRQKVRVSVLANDTGLIGPPIPMIVTPPLYGSATVDDSGRILYAHTNGTSANDTFSYSIRGIGGTSTPATVSIQFSTDLRLGNEAIQIPSNPPVTLAQFTPAFGNLTFTRPLCLRTPPNETNRLFVCEKGGVLRVISDLTAPTVGVFLNLPSLLSSRGESISAIIEQGLLGMTFHPGYATNGFFFVYYSVNTNRTIYERVSRFRVSAGNSNVADSASEVILFSQTDPAGNHNGGDLHFGPDGYLYISLGDGGGGGDFYNNSQRIDLDFFSAIARIDVDHRPGNLAPNPHAAVPLYAGQAAYSVPADNPFVGATNFNGLPVDPSQVRTEFYAVGLRNPWRFSFDPVTSNLWCGDVGALSYEEVLIVRPGSNHGWAYREGAHPAAKASQAPADFDALYHTPPLYEYTRGRAEFQGWCVTGGFVYRGAKIPSLYGQYVFADFGSGHVWAMSLTNGTPSVSRITDQTNVVAFAPDPSNGDVLVVDFYGGRILRLTAETPAGTYPRSLSETGLFADVTDLSPAPGVLPYEPNLPFWSDHAITHRWFSIPTAASRMIWSRDGLWTFPAGQVWVQHFAMEMERGNPVTRRRLETRLLVRNQGGVYGVSYHWNATQTDATLALDSGMEINLSITNGTEITPQQWRIPSRSECLACHTPHGGYALSFTTRQLNRTATLNGFHGNQLELLRDAGYFTTAPEPVNTLPRHAAANDATATLETRVRSYLDVNCAYCHLPDGVGGQSWDGRASIPLSAARIINGAANNNGGNPENKLVVPRDPLH